MSSETELNIEELKRLYERNEYGALVEALKEAFKIHKDENGAHITPKFDKEELSLLVYLVSRFSRILPNQEYMVETFKSLRNCCLNPEVQDYLLKNGVFFKDTKALLGFLMEKPDEHEMLIKMVVQFLINVQINNERGQHLVREQFFDLVMELIVKKCCVYESSALVYNLIKQYPDRNHEEEVYKTILDAYVSQSNEFLRFLLEIFITHEEFWEWYRYFGIEERLCVLEIIRDVQIKQKCDVIHKEGLQLLRKQFSDSGKVIFQTIDENSDSLEPFEITLILEVLCSFSGDGNSVKILQHNTNLLLNSGVILINIHRLGKQSENYFTSVQKLSEIKEPNEIMRQHPAFGIKCSLVRLIGNLCWKNKKMQDLARIAELIPVLLDCCNIDARNPFIMQWVILAIRNLCENNEENQKFIAGLHKQGVVNSATLHEMGLTLHDEGADKIGIIPLDTLKNIQQ